MRHGGSQDGVTERIDIALLQDALSNPESFGRFYDRHSRAVLEYFGRRTACSHTAADLTAETFAEALRTLHRFRPDRGVPRAWLFGIAQNQLRHYLRKNAVSERALRKLGMEPPTWDHADAVAMAADLARLRPTVNGSLDRLSPAIRQAVVLRVIDGLPYRDVAKHLGCSEGAARVRVTRGLSQLQDDDDIAEHQTRSSIRVRPEAAP